MPKSDATPTVEPPAVDPKIEENKQPPAEETNPPTAPELDQATQDALLSAQGGVDGTLTPNTPVEEDNEPEGNDNNNDADATSPADGATPDKPTDGSKPDSETTTKPEDNKPAPELKPEEPPTPKVEDPGEFKPGDYSFEIKTTDGKTVKITSQEDIEEFAAKLDEKPELVSASQYTLFNRKSVSLDQGLANDKSRYEAQKAEYDKEQTLIEDNNKKIVQLNNEMNYLAKNGNLPEITDELNASDWSDPKVAEEPAVKARIEILRWMEAENAKRVEAGLERVTSAVDAYNTMQLEALKQQQSDDVSREKTARQDKGSMVGGSAPHNPANNPANSIIGLGGSLDDVVTEFFNQ